MNTIANLSDSINRYSAIYMGLIVVVLLFVVYMMWKKKMFESLTSGRYQMMRERMIGGREYPMFGVTMDNELMKRNARFMNRDYVHGPYYSMTPQELTDLGFQPQIVSEIAPSLATTASASLPIAPTAATETFVANNGYLPDPKIYPYAAGSGTGVITVDSIVSGGSKLRNKSERSDSSWDWSNQYGGPGESGWRRAQEDYEFLHPYAHTGGAHGNYLPSSEQYLYQSTLGY